MYDEILEFLSRMTVTGGRHSQDVGAVPYGQSRAAGGRCRYGDGSTDLHRSDGHRSDRRCPDRRHVRPVQPQEEMSSINRRVYLFVLFGTTALVTVIALIVLVVVTGDGRYPALPLDD